MRHILFAFAILATPVQAGQIFKCKGPKGEVIYSNIKCPEKSEVQSVSTYQVTPDAPDHLNAARAETPPAGASEPAVARDQQTESAMERQSDVAAAAMRDRRAIAGREQIEADKHSDAIRNAKYREDLARWGERMAGPAPPGYSADSKRDDEERPIRDTVTEHAQKPPAYTTGCRQTGYSVRCNNSDGSMSHGSVDPYGNGSVHGADGFNHPIRRDAFGHSTVDGKCVKDIYGQCP